MAYKDEFKEKWLQSGGLITKMTAARILGVSESVITRHPELKRYQIDEDEFVSFKEILESNIKPRMKRGKRNKNNGLNCIEYNQETGTSPVCTGGKPPETPVVKQG